MARTRSEATKSIFIFKDNIERKLSIRRNLKLSSCPMDCKNIEYNIAISRSCESSKNPNRQPNEDFSEMTSNLDGTKRSYEVASGV